SPAAERLDHLRLWRPGTEQDRTMRSRMTHGNRLYVGRAAGGFDENRLSASIARSGWAWGCSALDFDNDGFLDVYLGNGLESNVSVRDYEPECWLHDKYVGGRSPDPATLLYLKAKIARTRGRDYSQGGYEKNRFYINQGGESFLEAGYLMGLALESDTRNVASDDLDGDGRLDLILTTVSLWPQPRRKLHVYRNELPETQNWIGFRLRESPGASPVGTRITLQCGAKQLIRQIVTGDSFRTQHASTVHFGIGAEDSVQAAVIEWTNGGKLTLRAPKINRYHSAAAPSQK
ncbi:MAG TPA: CRTAC1 family protein, partial [Verrucomicrobiae bacterium]|nr:CRTAC1 family protein [Verrucomicrobiae bacterium]